MRALIVVIVIAAAGAVTFWQLGFLSPQPRLSPEELATQELFATISTASPEQLQSAFASGADVSYTDDDAQTLLMLAAKENNNPQAILSLLDAGADVNARSVSGVTALMLAARYNTNPEIALLLLNAGANPTLTDSTGMSAYSYAADNGPVRRSSAYFLLESLTADAYDSAWPSGYIVPVQGATFSSRASHLPGSLRAYRNGYHEGFDFYNGVSSITISYGTPILSVAIGKIIRVDHNYVEMTPEAYQGLIDDAKRRPITPQETLDKLRGRQVWIEHPGGFVSRYAHLSSIPESLVVGMPVNAGDVVGFAGNSGTIEGVNQTQDEPHPHYELWRGDSYIGEGLEPAQIYTLVEQIFGKNALPPFLE